MHYRHMIFVRKDTNIKYLCAMILRQKYIQLKGWFHFILQWWPFLILWRENTTNEQCIISTTQTPFPRQRTIMRKLKTHGVTRKVMSGILSHVTQEELKSKKAQIETRGTSKEAVTEGYPKCTNLIEASIYDTTPIHYISMVSEDLKWILKQKECFNVYMDKVKH